MVKELVKISEKRRSTGESRAGEIFWGEKIITNYFQSLTGKMRLPLKVT